MYNDKRKQGFLKKIRSRDALAKRLFASSALFEKKIDKDICLFDEDELNGFLREEFSRENDSLFQVVHILKQYARYCRHLHEEASDSYSKIKIDPVDEARETLFASPLHLASKLDLVFTDLNEDNVDILCRCFLWLAFAEMEDIDIVSVKRSDVDLASRNIHFEGLDYKIYEEAYKTFELACTLPSFKVSVQKGCLYQSRSNPDMLLGSMERGEYVPKLKLADFRARISAAGANSGVPLSYNSVRMSGLFYRVYERERAGLVGVLEDEFQSFDGRGAKTDGTALAKSVRRTRRGIVEKYKAWKKAFEV